MWALAWVQTRSATLSRSIPQTQRVLLMWTRKIIGTAGAFAALVFSASAVPAHSLYEAKDTLASLGYYEVQVERASLPYSFSACKRGVRYHIHVDYYGTLVQVD